jgi:hypothetical protein
MKLTNDLMPLHKGKGTGNNRVIVEVLRDMGIIKKRKLNKVEQNEIVLQCKRSYPKGGDKALDLAVTLSIFKLLKGRNQNIIKKAREK